jgi:multicomponent Na+:H+ antiporter subunit B
VSDDARAAIGVDPMIGRYPSQVVTVVSHLVAPFVMIFGFYIIAHGHYGPGGGFAGGVAVAVAVILFRITTSEERSFRRFPFLIGPLSTLAGMFVFVMTGLIPLIAGGAFLDYAQIEVAGLEASRMRYLGILVVEVAIGFAVAGAILTIFDVLLRRVD